MSVFGGDSWAREAKQRKRRVDDLLVDGVDSSSFNRLSNGKLTCLVCPNRPVLDSSLMLSMHCKGARHRAELSKLKEKDLLKRDEVNKRIALSDSPVSQGNSTSTPRPAQTTPLIMCTKYFPKSSENVNSDAKSNCDLYSAQGVQIEEHKSLPDPKAELVGSKYRLEIQKRRERELKFTAAGWKRDGYGRWYRDENVEFDSDDEEDPNIVLA